MGYDHSVFIPLLKMTPGYEFQPFLGLFITLDATQNFPPGCVWPLNRDSVRMDR